MWGDECPPFSGFFPWFDNNKINCFVLQPKDWIVMFTPPTDLPEWRLCFPTHFVEAERSVSQHLLDVWRVDKTHASQKSRTIFTLFFQYPLHFFYSLGMIGSLVICTRLAEPKKDCSCLTSSLLVFEAVRVGLYRNERDWLKNNKRGSTFSPPLLEIILFLTWVIGKDFRGAPSVSDGFVFMSKLDFLI